MQRSPTTDAIKRLSLAGKLDKEISAELGLDITLVRNRLNWLLSKGELPHAGNKVAAIRHLAADTTAPEYYLRMVTRLSEDADAATPLLALWDKQGGACALTGKIFEKSGNWSPVIVGIDTDSPILVAQAVNRIRGTLSVHGFVELCKLVASRS